MICFLSNHRDNFDDESPFHPDTSSTADRSIAKGCDSDAQPLSIEHFQEETKETFIEMMNEIKVCMNDLFIDLTTKIQYLLSFSGEKFQCYHIGW